MPQPTLSEHRPVPMLVPPLAVTPDEADAQLPEWADAHTERTEACWLWTGSVARRYGGQGGDRAIDSRTGRNAARAIWEAIHGPIPAGLVTRHTCDNAMCVRPSHLLIGTPHANSRDAVLRGRLRPGGRPARADQAKQTRLQQPRAAGTECSHEPCHEIATHDAPVPLCPHHLRRVYEYVEDLISLSARR